MPDPITIVLAENRQHFLAWCQDNRLDPRSRALLFLSDSSLQRLRGVILRRDIDRVIDLGGGPAHAHDIINTRFRR